MKKEYKKDQLTITWEPEKCIHSGKCWKGLNSVFKPRSRPWVNVNGADTTEITRQIKKCPSGALGYYFDKMNEEDGVPERPAVSPVTTIEVIENGPYMVRGALEILEDTSRQPVVKEKVFLCRCGQSSNKPYCDGSHKKHGFQG